MLLLQEESQIQRPRAGTHVYRKQGARQVSAILSSEKRLLNFAGQQLIVELLQTARRRTFW
jgi:hypothetical protein